MILPMKAVIIGDSLSGVKLAFSLHNKGFRVAYASKNDFVLEDGKKVSLREIFGNTGISYDVSDDINVDFDRRFVKSNRKYFFDKLVFALRPRPIKPKAINSSKQPNLFCLSSDISKIINKVDDDLIRRNHGRLTYAVIGGGISGVELAATLKCYVDKVADSGLKKIRYKPKVYLVEKQSKILPDYSFSAQVVASKWLEKLGVTVVTSHEVGDIYKDKVKIRNFELSSDNVFWVIGAAASTFFKSYAQYFKLSKLGEPFENNQHEIYRDTYNLISTKDSLYSVRKKIDFLVDLFDGDGPSPINQRVTAFKICEKSYIERRGFYVSGRFANRLYKKSTGDLKSL